MMTETCFACGGEAHLVTGEQTVQVGYRSVVVVGEFMRCSQCGEVYFLPGQMDAIQRTAADQARTEAGALTGGQIRAVRERLGLSQSEFEKLLGVGPKTAGRWERGTVFQGAAVDTLIRIIDEDPKWAERLGKRHGVRIASRAA
jgi:HTH-type transcriptional regulator/antitoxin MqsA